MGFGNRNCVVVGCSNSGKKLSKWSKSRCDIHGCNHEESKCCCDPPFKLFPFPTEKKDNEARQKWTRLIKRKERSRKFWKPVKSSRVCSEHFESGMPTAEHPFPTLNLGYELKAGSKCKPPSERASLPAKKRKARVATASFDEQVNLLQETLLTSDSSKVCDSETYVNGIIHDHGYSYGWKNLNKDNCCMDNNCLSEKKAKDEEIEQLNQMNKELMDKLSLCQLKLKLKSNKGIRYTDLKTDNTVLLLTGIPSIEAFDKLFDGIRRNIKKINYWSGPTRSVKKGKAFTKSPKKFGPNRTLSEKNEFLLTLMKLRLGSTYADLAQRFNVSITTVSFVFTTWLKILAKELNCFVYNPPLDVVKRLLPPQFRKPGYSKVRHIIDCTEIFLETPSDPVLRAATWSDYKHHNTAKVLVSITPNGAFNFVSHAWGGRTSDVYLTRESSFYDILEPYDEVMADRGFTIQEDLLLHRATLHIPPGKRGREQFTKAEVKKTKTIANLRIFVEQAIRRLKTFHILKHELPLALLSKLDDILVVCTALCNMYKPLCK